MEPLAIKAAGKFQSGIKEVQHTSQVSDYPDLIVFELLVIRFRFIGELHLVSKPGTATAGYPYPNELIIAVSFFIADLGNLFLSAIGNVYHAFCRFILFLEKLR